MVSRAAGLVHGVGDDDALALHPPAVGDLLDLGVVDLGVDDTDAGSRTLEGPGYVTAPGT